MSTLILSDIHGSLPALKKVLTFFETCHCTRLLLLGDYLNYGPRNGLPEGLDAMGVAEELNKYVDVVTAIRGNCDSEVDQMLLHFPIMADYAEVKIDEKRIVLTHGHVYDEEKRPSTPADIFLYGHTHLPVLKRDEQGILICNPGSITFPKGGNPPSFGLITNGEVEIITLDGQVLANRSSNIE